MKKPPQSKTQPWLKEEIEYQGVTIGIYDYRALTIDEAILAMEHNAAVLENRGETDQRHILHVTGVTTDKKALAVCKKVAPVVEPYVYKTAVVGIPSIQHFFLNFLNSIFKLRIQAFDDLESAKEWLVLKD